MPDSARQRQTVPDSARKRQPLPGGDSHCQAGAALGGETRGGVGLTVPVGRAAERLGPRFDDEAALLDPRVLGATGAVILLLVVGPTLLVARRAWIGLASTCERKSRSTTPGPRRSEHNIS